MIDVALVGTGGMLPLAGRHLTALLLRHQGAMTLVDCGEGTQVSLRMLGWGFKEIGNILLTHFHADHIAGLPGLLLTIGNAGRTEPLYITGPRGVETVVQCLCCIAPELPYEIRFQELPPPPQHTAFSIGALSVSALPLNHHIDCFGYSFTLPRAGKFDAARAKNLHIPVQHWSKLQKGETVTLDGDTFTPDMVMGAKRRGIKVSYITDTRPVDTIPDLIQGSDLFVCEGMYGENEKRENAVKHKHMLFSEAAELARRGGVGELWLTHFSPAMPNPEEFLELAQAVFPNTKIGVDRMHTTIAFSENASI